MLGSILSGRLVRSSLPTSSIALDMSSVRRPCILRLKSAKGTINRVTAFGKLGTLQLFCPTMHWPRRRRKRRMRDYGRKAQAVDGISGAFWMPVPGGQQHSRTTPVTDQHFYCPLLIGQFNRETERERRPTLFGRCAHLPDEQGTWLAN